MKYRFDWDWVQQMADQYGIFVWRKDTPEFVESNLIQEIKSPDLVRMIYRNCDRTHLFSCHTIHEGSYYMCEPSLWMEGRLGLHGIEFENREVDSVPIHDNPNLYDDLSRFIRNQEPLKACSYCLGSWARSTPNEQLSTKNAREFVARQPDRLADLVSTEWIVPRPYVEQNDA